MACSGDVDAGETAEVTLWVEQVFINNSSRDVNNVFAYELVSLDKGNPMPLGASGGTYSFKQAGTSSGSIPITFTNAGIYQYEMSANTLTYTNGYSYDPQAYKIMVFVKMTDGKLSAQIVVKTSSGDKSDSISFKNTYTPLASDPELMEDLPVQKTVSGSPSGPRDFTFTLTSRDTAAPMPKGSINGVKTVTIVGSGEAQFGTWAYTAEGTYYYDITEVSSSNTGYTYDQSVYTITDVVKDTDGRLVVTRTVTNEWNKLVGSFIFINKYNKRGNGGGGGGKGNVTSTTGTGATEAGIEDNILNDGSIIDGKDAQNDGSISVGGNVPKVGDDVRIEWYTKIFCLGAVSTAGCIIYLICYGCTKKRKKHDMAAGYE